MQRHNSKIFKQFYFKQFSFAYWPNGIVVTNGPGDRNSIPGRVIEMTPKMVLDAALLNTQHCKVRIKGKVEQSREKSGTLPLHLGVASIEKGAFGLPSTKVTTFTFILFNISVIFWPSTRPKMPFKVMHWKEVTHSNGS